MSDFYLDLKDTVRIMDFFEDYSDYATPKEREIATSNLKKYHAREELKPEKLVDDIRKFAQAVWPARFALRRFFNEEGAEEEWRRVTAAVRPSTAHVMKRFREGIGAHNLQACLDHDESVTAFTEVELMEIEEVRKQVRHDYWREKGATLDILFKSGQLELKAYLERLKRLRDLAAELPEEYSHEIYSKLERFEDRIFFEGEVVPLQILDEEVQYYLDTAEIPVVEG
ncbi:MAG: hypothetical protein RDU25_01305 [Patescibacteria group bacterium]|nr:hypothetical protein [Patescibacteria group bacterium]